LLRVSARWCGLPTERRALLAIVALAAVLRGSGLAWDGFTLQHPDERFLAFVAERVGLPRSPGELLDPRRTPTNPNNQGFDFFVYGALPPLVNGVVARLLGVGHLEGIVAVGRVLTCALDVGVVLLLFTLGRRLGGARAGLVAATLWATCGVAIQQARFATVDVWGSAAALAVVATVVGRRLSGGRVLAAGALAGLAAACKPNLITVLLVPAAAIVVDRLRARAGAPRGLPRAVGKLLLLGVAAVATLKVADPGAFAGVLTPWPSPARLEALGRLQGIFAGAGQYPPNLQWADRRAVLDPLTNTLVWGTGPLLGLAVLIGVGWVLKRAALGETSWLPPLAWAVPVGAWQLTRFVCSVRHLHPLLPLATLAAALWLARRARPWWRVAVVAATALWGVAWASIGWQEHTRIAASRWLAEHMPAGSVLTAEYWDDALPLAGHGDERFDVRTLAIFEPDTPAKREALLEALAAADAVVLASQRGVGSITRVPDAYPLTAEFYHLLFSGALGFDLAATFQRRLGWGALSLADLRGEEALSVYDHPPVWIFRKTPRYSPALARALLERVPLPGSTGWHTRELEARGTPPFLTVSPGRYALPGTFASGLGRQVVAVALWLVIWEALGIVGRALTVRVAPTLPDGGWGVSRWVGGAVAGLVWLWLGWVGVPGWNGVLPLLLLAATAPWAGRAWWRAWADRRFRLATAVSWSFFAAFLLVRAANPEVYWGEKPMDAAILAGIFRGESLPPADPWFAGSHLEYYFFGFLPHALVGRAAGIGLGVAFNLAAATVPALVAGAALSAGWLIAGRAAGGVLAALLAQGVGTAAAVVRPDFLASPDFSSFWASSRVIPETINEYPVWTALFADLHAHFLAFPGFLAAVTLASGLALGLCRRTRSALAAGAVLAVQWMTNAWELPALAVLLTLALVLRRDSRGARRGLVSGGRWVAVAGTAAMLVSAPFWLLLRQPAVTVAWGRGTAMPLTALGELFGVVAALLVVAALAGRGATAAAPWRWGWTVVGVGLALVLAPAVVTVADPMNTVFKLHLQAHLLLGAAAGGLVGGALGGLRGAARAAVGVAVAAAMGVGLATSAADALSVVRTRRAAGPRPTLDGAAYLARHHREQAAALAALARLSPPRVVVEPTGPPYSDTLRVPMFTGHPAVVGWEVHLWQRHRSWVEIRLRQEDTAVLTWGADPEVVGALARRYSVGGACSWGGPLPAVAGLPGWTRLGETVGVSVAPEGRQGASP